MHWTGEVVFGLEEQTKSINELNLTFLTLSVFAFFTFHTKRHKFWIILKKSPYPQISLLVCWTFPLFLCSFGSFWMANICSGTEIVSYSISAPSFWPMTYILVSAILLNGLMVFIYEFVWGLMSKFYSISICNYLWSAELLLEIKVVLWILNEPISQYESDYIWLHNSITRSILVSDINHNYFDDAIILIVQKHFEELRDSSDLSHPICLKLIMVRQL